MALTCRGFFDPAMDALWRHPRDGMCLVDLLTDTSFARVNMDGESVEMMALRPPSASDWVRFSKYARRVHTLDVISYTETTDLPLHWCAVLEHFPGIQALPRLRSVLWEWAPECNCSHAPLLITPPLRKLVVDGLDERGIAQLIDVLPGCSETMEYLEISTRFLGEREPQLAEGLWQALAMLQRVGHLDISLYSPKAFRHLASLSNVKTLRLVIDSLDLEDTRLPFPSLTSFDISAKTDMDAVAKLLRRMALPALKHLNIIYHIIHRGTVPLHRPTAAHVQLVVQEVSKLTSLRSLTIKSSRPSSRDPVEALDASVLAPLHALRELETLDLSVLAFSLTAADIEPMARSWPRMQCLRLYQSRALFGERPLRMLSLDDILPFARLCPHLRELAVFLQLASETELEKEWTTTHANLRKLWVSDVSSPRCVHAVRLLAKNFPVVTVESFEDTRLDKVINGTIGRLVHGLYGARFDRGRDEEV
ncbi:hypothetical protein PsYK624_118800 [Phanerochaete sordida]|uniref:F-box domain-containing protein n=1 Tax=Phanerochaete sordida TaxID=48140 RepID=A0A9P3LII1_9APHY|nr:hypothetical protein PsYK624_118800 [Phanerochaete sordida]